MPHSHDHGGGCCHSQHAEQSVNADPEEMGVQYSLFEKIDFDKLVCLNEEVDGSGRKVFKSWEKRLDRAEFVQSDVDAELLFNVPFTGHVKLKAVMVFGGEVESHPKEMRLFKNSPQLDFDAAHSSVADQTVQLVRRDDEATEYSVMPAKFSGLYQLSIYFPSNFSGRSDTQTKICYIGLRGEFTQVPREKVVVATYEARAMMQDHKGEIPDGQTKQIF